MPEGCLSCLQLLRTLQALAADDETEVMDNFLEKRRSVFGTMGFPKDVPMPTDPGSVRGKCVPICLCVLSEMLLCIGGTESIWMSWASQKEQENLIPS